MERRRRLQERPMGPDNLARMLRDCEDENMVLRLDLENLDADLQDCEMANKALNKELQGLKRERALCRREHGNTARTDREEFAAQLKAEQEEKRVLRRQNEELCKQLKEQAMKLKACEMENKTLQQETQKIRILQKGEQLTDIQAENREDILRRENEGLRKEMKECKEKLQSAHELAMNNMEVTHWQQIEGQKMVLRELALGVEIQRQEKADLHRDVEELKEMLQKAKELVTECEAEKVVLRQQNEDLSREVKHFKEKLHSAPEGLAMKNKVSEMEKALRKATEELTEFQKRIASSTVNLNAKLKEQDEKKEALQRKVEELTKMFDKERESSFHEQTIKLEALEQKVEEFKKFFAEEATTKNISIERKAEKEKEDLRQKVEEQATQLKVEEVEKDEGKSNNREAEVGGSGEEELLKKTKKPSMFRRCAKLFTSTKRKEKRGKKKEKMETA
ncbi:trichohyalin-like [Centroberyx affinis]|uniref:trichohyalin-like n=1 Tax=Centroberyx affinis TaxID=166261 RepID=UPI003A5BC67A